MSKPIMADDEWLETVNAERRLRPVLEDIKQLQLNRKDPLESLMMAGITAAAGDLETVLDAIAKIEAGE